MRFHLALVAVSTLNRRRQELQRTKHLVPERSHRLISHTAMKMGKRLGLYLILVVVLLGAVFPVDVSADDIEVTVRGAAALLP